MFEKYRSISFNKTDDPALLEVTIVGLIPTNMMAQALEQFQVTDAANDAAPVEGNGRRRRGSSAAVTDAAASTSTEPTATTAADAAPATGRRRRGAATEAPAATDAASAATEAPAGGRRRRTAAAPAPEPETPKIDTSNPGITVAATMAVKMIGNPADVVVLVKDFLDANGKPCENVSDIVQGEREEFLQELNRLVVEKTAKPLPGIG